jgi:nitroreductase
MEFYDVLRTRRSIRKYKPAPVEREKLDRLLEAVRLAPSAKNLQPRHFIVVTDAATRRALGEAYPREWFTEAPVIICACGEPAAAWVRRDGKSYLDVDVAIAFEHLVLAAAAEGLATCWIGAFDPGPVKRVLGLPPGIEPIVMTPLGYADEEPRPFSRKPIAELARFEKW